MRRGAGGKLAGDFIAPVDEIGPLWNRIEKTPFIVVAGPCVIESEDLCLRIAERLRKICDGLGLALIFKASYDKANRTSGRSFRGPGLEAGLAILARVRGQLQVPLLTDVHTVEETKTAAAVVDCLQIPAFLCRQTDLVQAAARTGKIVNLKKGQFLAPIEMRQVVEKARQAGGRHLLLTERGTTFGYHNLVADMRAVPILRENGCPVLFDATHSVQLPGAGGTSSSGQRRFAPVLARAAVAAGADGVFFETHPDPDRALSDGPNSLPLEEVPGLLNTLLRIREIVRVEAAGEAAPEPTSLSGNKGTRKVRRTGRES